jgi:hypothetical protein
MPITRKISRWLTPISVAIAGSLLLSLVARLGSTINRDGMLYIGTAQAFLDGGFAAAKANFAWPFLSIAIAAVSKLTGLGLENAAYLLNALFMAATCALMVSCVARRTPELAWMSCLAVLALPGFNEYRNELLREFGCWFFVMLSFWLSLRWDERPDWRGALSIQIALGCAALFRPEALALYAALVGWQLFSAPRSQWLGRLVMIGLLPVICGTLLVTLYLSGKLGDGRLAAEFSRLGLARFDSKAEVLASGLIEYARGNARAILLFGSLALIPVKLIQKFGIFLLPLVYLIPTGELHAALRRHALFAWGIVVHLIVLTIFVTDLQFLAGRYVGMILLLSTPFAATGLLLLAHRFPRGRLPLVAIGIVLAFANVVSTGHGKSHHVDAGRWLAANVADPAKIYIDSGRAAYHAGWHKAAISNRNDRDGIARAVSEGRHELFVLEISRKDPPSEPWLQQAGLRVTERFELANKDAVIVAVPVGSKAR